MDKTEIAKKNGDKFIVTSNYRGWVRTASTLEDAIAIGVENCKEVYIAYVQEVDVDQGLIDRATVVAPCYDLDELITTHREVLRAALFGDGPVNVDYDDEEEERIIKESIKSIKSTSREVFKDAHEVFVISDEPVVDQSGRVYFDVFYTEAVRTALFMVFWEEVRKVRDEQAWPRCHPSLYYIPRT